MAGEARFPIEKCKGEKLIVPGLGSDVDAMALFDEFGIKPDIAFSTVECFSALQMAE